MYLLQRLTSQLASTNSNPEQLARQILQKRGHMDSEGNLTPAGINRQMLGEEGRAKDRAAKRTGRRPSEFKYDQKTNRATLRFK